MSAAVKENESIMARLVWFVLKDGSSIVAGCGGETKDSVARALAEPDHKLTLTTDDGVDELPSSAVRDFVLFDARAAVPAATSIYRLVHL